ALFRREQGGVAFVGENGEKRFLVRDLATQRVGDADAAPLVGVDERAALALARDHVVDEDATIDEVDALPVGVQAGRWTAGRTGRDVLQVPRIADDRRHALRRERIAQDLEFTVGRHL